MLKVANVATISFLSSCTVLSMSLYNVCRSIASKEQTIDVRRSTPLAVGAVAGGVGGGILFQYAKAAATNIDRVGAVQAICLAGLTLACLLYTLLRKRIQAHALKSKWMCVAIGMGLGGVSSFLGIGGGPINLVAFYYFFSMEPKAAAQNSLYVILFSQAANLLTLLATGSVPEFSPLYLLLMVLGGITGGAIGRMLHSRVTHKTVQCLFVTFMGGIIFISIYNAFRYA